MRLTVQQKFHLKRALLEGKLDTLDKRNSLRTIKGLLKENLVRSEPKGLGLMARFFVVTPKGSWALDRYKTERAA